MSYGATENFGCAQPGMPQVLKVRRLHIFAISSEKVGNEVDFFPADKYESVLQVNSITLGVCSQAYTNYSK